MNFVFASLILFLAFSLQISCTKKNKQTPPKNFLQAELCGNYLDDGLCSVGEFSKGMEKIGSNSGNWSKSGDELWIYKIKMDNGMTGKSLKLAFSIKVDKKSAVVNGLAVDDEMVNAFGLTSSIYPFITAVGKITKKSDSALAAHKVMLKKRREEEAKQKKSDEDKQWKEINKQANQQELVLRVGNKKILKPSGRETSHWI